MSGVDIIIIMINVYLNGVLKPATIWGTFAYHVSQSFFPDVCIRCSLTRNGGIDDGSDVHSRSPVIKQIFVKLSEMFEDVLRVCVTLSIGTQSRSQRATAYSHQGKVM